MTGGAGSPTTGGIGGGASAGTLIVFREGRAIASATGTTLISNFTPNPRTPMLTLVVYPEGNPATITVRAQLPGMTTPVVVQQMTAPANTMTAIPVDGYYNGYEWFVAAGHPNMSWRLLGG